MTAKFAFLGYQHIVVLAVISVASLFLVVAAQVIRPRALRLIEVGLASALFFFEISALFYGFTPGHFRIDRSLPLNLCDLVAFSTIAGLLYQCVRGKALSFYCGLTFGLLATIAPDLDHGFPSFRFLSFFAIHGLIIVSAIFMVAAKRLYPSLGLVRTAVTSSVSWALFVYPINCALGSNYFYVNQLPEPKAIERYLGGWPTYLVTVSMVATVLWIVMTLPWEWRNGRKGMTKNSNAI